MDFLVVPGSDWRGWSKKQDKGKKMIAIGVRNVSIRPIIEVCILFGPVKVIGVSKYYTTEFFILLVISCSTIDLLGLFNLLQNPFEGG